MIGWNCYGTLRKDNRHALNICVLGLGLLSEGIAVFGLPAAVEWLFGLWEEGGKGMEMARFCEWLNWRFRMGGGGCVGVLHGMRREGGSCVFAWRDGRSLGWSRGSVSMPCTIPVRRRVILDAMRNSAHGLSVRLAVGSGMLSAQISGQSTCIIISFA